MLQPRLWASAPWKAVVLVPVILLAILYAWTYTSSYVEFKAGAHAATAALTHTTTTAPKHYERPLVLYAYAESDTSRENLEFFVKKGLHGLADFVFIFNGATNATALVPALPNVEVVERNNSCYDLGAYGEVLRRDDRWKGYKRFVMMNASLRGPFFPNYMQPCWTDAFLNRINERIKLVGTTINCWPRPHLQSMLLATDDVGMGILLDPALATSLQAADKWGGKDDPVGLTACYADRSGAVHAEIGLTGLVRSQGFEVDVMLASFSVDDEDLPSYCADGKKRREDPLVEGHYFGTSIHPYEMVFIKTNRGIIEKTMTMMTELHLSRSWSSWDSCTL